MPQLRKVALLMETDRAYGRGLLRGIARYVRLHGPWTFYVEPGTIEQKVPRLADWGCEGIIARMGSSRRTQQITALGLPTIALAYEVASGQVRVGTHSQAEGRMAAEHLLDRGLQHFAFCGFSERVYSERLEGYAQRLSESGRMAHVYRRPWIRRDRWWAGEQQDLAGWIASLPKPLGLFACNDDQGRRVLDACQAAGIAVPEQAAVLAVDNDELLCDLCRPPMSSIALGTEKAGFEAAALLDQMMAGNPPLRPEIIVEPLWVVPRQSTDVLAIEDPEVAQAVRFIREHAANPIRVDDVLEAVPVSRRALECRFRRVLGRSPNAEILRVHLERAQMLLATTDLPIPRVAAISGFNSPDYMGYVFRRWTGMKPLQYRREQRGEC
jgi:LacI family transcriptional regulator